MEKKNKKIKVDKPELIRDVNEDTNQVKKFVFILIGLALIVALMYFLTSKYLIKDNYQDDNAESTEVTISYDNIKIGNVFNRPYDKYYVLAYDSTSTKASYLSTLFTSFKESGSKIYFLDLSLEVNKKYVGQSSNKKATNSFELSLTNPTLIVIVNGKISKYYDTMDEIVNVLK